MRITNNAEQELSITGTHNHLESYTVPTPMPLTIPAGGYADIIVRFFPEELGQLNDVLTIYSQSLYADSLPQLIARQVILKGSKTDNQPPSAVIEPGDGSTDLPQDTIITIRFNEGMMRADGNIIRNDDLAGIVVFKENDENGEAVPFRGNIDLWKKVITIRPDSLKPSQTYFVSIPGETLSDKSGNLLVETVSAGFTTEAGSDVFDDVFQSVSVFPNPTKAYLQISYGDHRPSAIRIFSLQGRLVGNYHPGNRKTGFIDLGRQASGIYILEIDFPGLAKPVSFKVIKH